MYINVNVDKIKTVGHVQKWINKTTESSNCFQFKNSKCKILVKKIFCFDSEILLYNESH